MAVSSIRSVPCCTDSQHHSPEDAYQAAQQQAARHTTLPRGPRGVVLAADDDAEMRVVLARLLKRLGFDALIATDGREALALWQSAHQTISCTLLDVTMPHLSGIEVMRQIEQTHPDARIVLMSGYSSEHIPPTRANGVPLLFLPKPFGLIDLESILDRSINMPFGCAS
jgi:CheY-like chemotaxis protein